MADSKSERSAVFETCVRAMLREAFDAAGDGFNWTACLFDKGSMILRECQVTYKFHKRLFHMLHVLKNYRAREFHYSGHHK